MTTQQMLAKCKTFKKRKLEEKTLYIKQSYPNMEHLILLIFQKCQQDILISLDIIQIVKE